MGVRDLLRDGLTASATRAESKSGGRYQTGTVRDSWQKRAWRYVRDVGELGNAAKFYERPLSKLYLEPEYEVRPGLSFTLSDMEAIRGGSERALPEGVTVEALPVDADLAAVRALWDDFQDKGGGREHLQGRYGRIDFVNGEMYLAALWDEEDNGAYWAVKSKYELRPSSERDGEWKLYKNENDKEPEKLMEPTPTSEGGEAQMGQGMVMPYRVWNPDGEYSHQADAPMRLVIERAEDLIIASRSIRATGRSRIARAGILYINERALSGRARPKPGEPDPFLTEFGQFMMASLGTDGDASEVVPFVMTGSLPANEAMARITFSEREGYPELPVIDMLIKRVSIALDMPPETLTGKAAGNHWTSWLITDDEWQHVQPVASRMCSDFTSVYLRPRLQAAGVEPEAWKVGYDNSAVVVNPDRGKDADAAHDRNTISDKAHREAKGFKEDDAPTDANPNTNPKVILAERGSDGGAGATDSNAQDQQPPDEGQASRHEVMAAADVALARCREVAGSRIRSKLTKHNPADFDAYRHVPLDKVAAMVGADLVAQRVNGSGDSGALVSGGSACFAAAMEGRLPAATIAHLRGVIETYAAQTLYLREPGRVPV